MHRRLVVSGVALLFLAGCAGRWEVAYDSPVDAAVARTWNVTNVVAVAPETLSVSNANTFAPNADVVWHGEPLGDRRAQVAQVLEDGIRTGAATLKGPRKVTITATVLKFHGVTPASIANAPGAVHNIRYATQVLDSETGRPLTPRREVAADLEAYVGAAAVTAAVDGNTQRVRIVNHIARVTRGWLGIGPDQRRTFTSFGR